MPTPANLSGDAFPVAVDVGAADVLDGAVDVALGFTLWQEYAGVLSFAPGMVRIIIWKTFSANTSACEAAEPVTAAVDV